MNSRIIPSFAAGLFAAAVVSVTVAQTLDQSYDPATTTLSYGVDGTHTRAQTFTVGIDGTLVGVSIYTQAVSGDTLFWDVRNTTGGAPAAAQSTALASGSLLSSSLPSPSPAFYYFDLSSFNLNVASGNVLAFTMRGSTGNTVGVFYGRNDNGYAGGAAFTGASGATTAWSELANVDFKFRTYITPIPEPAAFALAAGVAALGLMMWRRRRSA